jgi:hypothetical protein
MEAALRTATFLFMMGIVCALSFWVVALRRLSTTLD